MRLVLALVVTSACAEPHAQLSEAPRLAPSWSAPPSEAGAESCKDCHRELVQSWSRTGMARALGPVGPDELGPLGANGTVRDEPAGYRYEFQVAGDQASIVETHARAPGHRLAAPLEFAIGAGRLDRSFAARRGAFIWFAPLEVVSTQAGRHAALAPGHAISSGVRFDTAITPECLGCHTDAPPPRDFPLNIAPDASVWTPRGISCAACHGAVEQHVDWRSEHGGQPASAPGDPVLQPRALTRVQRLSICAACHLQGDARILLDAEQLGPPPPGGDLLEQRAVFVAAEPTQDVGFVSQVERLALSRCFLESDTLSCESCHDPHRSLDDEPERQRVRSACQTCHAQASAGDMQARASACSAGGTTSERDCVDCHMRLTPVFDVADVRIHDHFVRKRPGAPSRFAKVRYPESPSGDWKRFEWPGEPAVSHKDDPGLWMMAWSSRGHTERAAPLVDRTPGPITARLPMYHHVRGSLLEHLGRPADALSAYEFALALDPELGPSANNLGLLLGRQGRARAGLALLDRLLKRYPKAQGAYRNRAVVRQGLGDVEGAVRDMQAAFELLPDAGLAGTLATFCGQAGDREGARVWRRAQAALEPTRASIK